MENRKERVRCGFCPHHCELSAGQTGLCRVRTNRGGQPVCDSYGAVTALALDPIEKKPLNRFHPGSYILSVGSYGCSMRCPFCQNAEISQCTADRAEFLKLAPEELAGRARELIPRGNIGVAYTYNEPLTWFEYVRDCGKLVHRDGLFNVMVSNGMAADCVLDELLPLTDAWNIDLKTFQRDRYRAWGGDLDTVCNTISRAAACSHVEVTTLVIPGENDTEEEITRISEWLAEISPEIPLHISRFFPRYRMTDRPATPVGTVYALARCARRNLKYVYTGNC